MNKKIAQVVKVTDSHGDSYFYAVEVFENGKHSPFVIGHTEMFVLTNEGLDNIVRDAMDKGYDEVLVSDEVKDAIKA